MDGPKPHPPILLFEASLINQAFQLYESYRAIWNCAAAQRQSPKTRKFINGTGLKTKNPSLLRRLKNDEFFEAYAEELSEDEGDTETIKALQKTIASEFEKYAKIKKNIPEEALASVANAEDPRQLVDLIAGHLGIEVAEKQ